MQQLAFCLLPKFRSLTPAAQIYNRYSGPIAQRFAYIYQLDDDFTDIVPATLTNTSRVMEGLWMLKHGGTYFLFGSPLVVYDVADDFCTPNNGCLRMLACFHC